ncbi:hypothetical protein, partial [Clostridioides difficile]
NNVSVLVKAGAVSETTATDSVANATFEVKKHVAAPISTIGKISSGLSSLFNILR